MYLVLSDVPHCRSSASQVLLMHRQVLLYSSFFSPPPPPPQDRLSCWRLWGYIHVGFPRTCKERSICGASLATPDRWPSRGLDHAAAKISLAPSFSTGNRVFTCITSKSSTTLNPLNRLRAKSHHAFPRHSTRPQASSCTWDSHSRGGCSWLLKGHWRTEAWHRPQCQHCARSSAFIRSQ